MSGKASYALGHRFVQKAYVRSGKLKSGKSRYYLNKPLVREALKVQTKLPFPEKMPRNIEKFNRRADAKYRKHEKAIDALLSSANLK